MWKTMMGLAVLGAMLQGCVLVAAKEVVESENSKMPAPHESNLTFEQFDKISLLTSADVVVQVGGKQSVNVKANAKPEDVLVSVNNGTLTIDAKNSWGKRKITVTVTVPKLVSAELAGSGDIKISNLNATSFSASVSGSGDVIASGTAGSVALNVSGSGDIDFLKVNAKTATASISGSGDINFYASESAACSIVGSGDMRVAGGGRITRSVTGSGEITTQ
jgi:hypothetical protein